MSFPLTLKRLRLERGLTQAALAARCGVAQPNLAAMENGARQPTLATLQRLADGLGVAADALLRPVGSGLDRFEMEAACRGLLLGEPRPERVDEALWTDLQAVFRPKLQAQRPGLRRPRLRISSNAAQRRLNARLGPGGLDEVARRLEKSA